MPWTNQHLQWLVDTGEVLTTQCGRTAKVYSFNYDVTNETVMSAWAKHFRNHYCDDGQIDVLKAPGQSNSEYLLEISNSVSLMSNILYNIFFTIKKCCSR